MKLKVFNPYSNDLISELVCDSKETIKKKLTASSKNTHIPNAEERSKILKNAAEIIVTERENIANLISSESGLSIKDTLYEVDRVVNVARYSSVVANLIEIDITKEFIYGNSNSPTLEVITEPKKLVIGITPFNHPMNQVAHKVFPAIAAGANIIIKPSEKTPLSALKLREILINAGMPENMFHIILAVNPNEALCDILMHKDIEMVSFTGGLEVGLTIQKSMVDSGHGLTKFVPELGGSSSLIVCSDANIDRAVDITINGCFKNSGQRCTAIRRVVIENKIKKEFEEKLLKKMQDYTYGDPSVDEMGTVIDEEACIKIKERINSAVNYGAKVIFGGNRNGAFIEPTILNDIDLKMEIVSKETFGPVCPIISTKNFEESLLIAKSTSYRLAGAIVTKDIFKAKKAADFLQVGQFNFNAHPGYRSELAPFGGFGNSGNGEKEGVLLAARSMRNIRTFYSH